MIDVQAISSGYRQLPVIRDITFQMDAGEIVGLLGLNGAGKSTLLKTILGLLPLQSGHMTVGGHQLTDDFSAYAQQIGYIPETPILYEELTLREHLEMTALGYGLPVELVMERAEPLLKLFRLDQQLDWFPTHFSKGMKQKVMIICALVLDLRLLIIDEPFLGLDPLAIQHLIELIQQKSQEGVSILFTTHVLDAAVTFCQRYLILNQGNLVADGTIDQLAQQANLPTEQLNDIYHHFTAEATSDEG